MQANRGHGEPAPERLLAILEATTDLVNLTDAANERVLYLNRAGRQMLGVALDDPIEGMCITRFHPSWALERIKDEGIPAALKDGVWVGETAFLGIDGREVFVSQLILAHRGPGGGVEYLSTIARDITEDRRSQEALRRSEQMFRIMTENASEMIALVDTSGKRIYNSPSYQRVLGYTPEELQGTWSLEQTHPEDRERILSAAHEAKTRGVGRFIEYRMRHKNGSWRTLESHAGVVRNARGEIENILIVARDITERKRAEEERDRMQLQLHHAQKMESIGRLAAGIAHEINTPIQYIGDNTRFLQDAFKDLTGLLDTLTGFLQAARANELTTAGIQQVCETVEQSDLAYLTVEIPRAIEQSLEGISRVVHIVSGMKQFSHPGTHEKEAVDLNRVIESTVTVARNEWKYVADLTTDLDSNMPLVPCLPGELNQVLLNLIVNAAHAVSDVVGEGGQGKGKGKIHVSTRSDGDFVEIRIEDSGSGIPKEVQPRIFEPFFTTKPFGKGTGQGLAIAHSVVVERHGGTISFETEIGKGTVFIIRLPVAGAISEKK